jgi:hypothetical protein
MREKETPIGATKGLKYIKFADATSTAPACEIIAAGASKFDNDAPAAVTTLPFSPKLIPLLFENVIADRLFDVLPAETLIAWLAVIVPTPAPVERPKVTPLLFAKVSADRAFDVPPPADTFKA